MSRPTPQLEVLGKKVTGKAVHISSTTACTTGTQGTSSSHLKKPLLVADANTPTAKKMPTSAEEAAAAVGLTQTSHATSSVLPLHHQGRASASCKATCPTTVVSATRSTTTRSSSANNTSAIEVSLVRNLKQQIACLEAQLRVAKQQRDAATRAHAKKADKAVGDAARINTVATWNVKDKGQCSKDVALPLPHAERVHHADVFTDPHTSSACDIEISRLRRIPEAYQLELSTLHHNVDSLAKDIEGLQSVVLDIGRERDAMAAEIVQLRAALRESRVLRETLAAESAATQRLLESERSLRRAAEDDKAANAKKSSSRGTGGSADLATVDAVSQRDYYRLQCDRLKTAVAREKARGESIAAALLHERGRASAQEKQLCSALDRIALMEKREHQLAAYYQSLSSRFVTISAMLQHVLDAVPESLLQQRRIPSPERADNAGEAEDAVEEVTLGEVRETLAAWHEEVLTNAAQLTESTAKAATDFTPKRLPENKTSGAAEGAASTRDTEPVTLAPPQQETEHIAAVPTEPSVLCGEQKKEVAEEKPCQEEKEVQSPPACTINDETRATEPSAQQEEAIAPPPSSSSPSNTLGANVTFTSDAEESSGEVLLVPPTATMKGFAVDVAVDAAPSADAPAETEGTINLSKAAASFPMTDDRRLDKEEEEEGETPEEVSSAVAASSEGVVQLPHPPAAAVPTPSTFTVLPPPPPPQVVALVPVPPPPASVVVPLPPSAAAATAEMSPLAVPLPPPPAAVVPPTVEQQISLLDARIEAQNASLAELVQRHKESEERR